LHHDFFAVWQVRQNRGRGVVPVPDVVVNHLEVPLALTGFDVYSNQAVGEQVAARTVSAVAVTGCRFNRQVNNSQFRVAGHWSPYTGVTGDLSTVTQPGVVAELATFRNGLECPQMFAGADVECTYVTFYVGL